MTGFAPLRCLALGLAAVASLLLGQPQTAAALEIEDIIGRKVTLAQPAKRVLLGEGRFLVAVSLLAPEAPLARVAGMLNEFRLYDPAGFAAYRDAFPEIETHPVFGQGSEESVSLESAIALNPDAAVFGISGHGPQERSKALIKRLEDAGIPVVFVDFRDKPLEHTARSMRILGQVLGLEAPAERFATFYEAELGKVIRHSEALRAEGPRVMIEARVGLGAECCFTIARGSMADMVAAAGGRNIALAHLPGTVGTLNLEYVIAEDPEVYLGTAVGSTVTMKDPAKAGRIVLGVGVGRDTARASLAGVLERKGLSSLTAVGDKRAFGLWHHFYNSPLNIYAVQQLAKWFHPERFQDLDPEATLENLLARLGPVDLSGTYGVALGPRQEARD